MFRRAACALLLLALSACAAAKPETVQIVKPKATAKNPCFPRPMMFAPCLPIVEAR